jgi:flagellar motor protein MotB
MKKEQPVIIIKKTRHGHGGHHGGAWKVAYADFVTAMMAFFLVMWLVSQKQEVRAAVGGYFRDPSAFTGGDGILDDHKSGVDPSRHRRQFRQKRWRPSRRRSDSRPRPHVESMRAESA